MEFIMILKDPAHSKVFQYLHVILSVCDAPNIGYTEKQLKELNNPHFNRLKKELIRFRASCIADTQTDLILTSEIVNSKKETEIELAMKHLDNLNQRIDMTNTITTYDRGYASLN